MLYGGVDTIRERLDAAIDRAPRLVAVAASICFLAAGYGAVREGIKTKTDQNNELTSQASVSLYKGYLAEAKQNHDVHLPEIQRTLSREQRWAKEAKTDTVNSFLFTLGLGVGALSLAGIAREARQRYRLPPGDATP